MQLILPKPHVFPDLELPFFFLAGPIRGGGDWQKSLIGLLRGKIGDDMTIANPARYNYMHALYQYRAGGDETFYRDQTGWERKYLEFAGKYARRGAILMWLPCEDPRKPRTEDFPYARDTYGEAGEWRGRFIGMGIPPNRLLVGAEPDFPGLKVIRRNFDYAFPGFRISESLDELAKRAAKLVKE